MPAHGKIGSGTGSRTIDTEATRRHVDFLTRAEVARAGLDLARRTIPTRPIIVAGHGEGAVVASLLAAGPANTGIDGLVSLSGPALPILSVIGEQVAAMSPPSVASDMTMSDRTAAAIRTGEAPSEDAKSEPQTAMLASMPEPGLAYLRSPDRVNPVAALAQVKVAVLIVQGGRDDSVLSTSDNMPRASRTSPRTDVATFPNLTHFYKVAPLGVGTDVGDGTGDAKRPAVADVAAWAGDIRR